VPVPQIDGSLVALAEPPRASGAHAEHRADVVPAALALEDQVVAAALLQRILLAVLGVEVGRVGRQGGLLEPVDVVVEKRDLLLAVVLDLDAGRLGEGHRPEAVVRRAVLDRDGHALDRHALAESAGEEVAHGCLDPGLGSPVPEDAQHHLLVAGRAPFRPGVRLRTEEGHPDVGDDARPLEVGEDVGLPRRHAHVVGVAVRVGPAVGQLGGRGDPPAAAFAESQQAVER